MHRIPLQLPSPSITWDRYQPEYILFEKTLNSRNIEETEKFFAILDQEMNDHFSFNYNYDDAANMLNKVRQFFATNNYDEIMKGIQIVTSVVLCTPKNSPFLQTALKLRGSCYYQCCHFECATNDFEMFLYLHSDPEAYEELFETHGLLVISFYLMRQYEKAQKYLQVYKNYKKKIDRHISQFMGELDNIENMAPTFSEEISVTIPYKGFNTSEDIPLSSAACYYAGKINNEKSPGIYTNCHIPKNNVILVEHPMLQSINTPFVQCELCFRWQYGQIFTCLKCRYKTYCSLKCMQKDKEMHYIECSGYRNLILLVLDASNLFRIFIRVSTLLRDRVFILEQFRYSETAANVLRKMEIVINEMEIHGIQNLKLLKSEANYMQLSDTQYATLVTTAFRLTMFIEKKIFTIETYYKSLQISNKEKLVLVGAILMRLHCHLLTNTFDFEYNYPLNVSKAEYPNVEKQIGKMACIIKPTRDGIKDDADFYYDINLEEDIIQRSYQWLNLQLKTPISIYTLPSFTNTNPCDRIQRHLTTYKDSISQLQFYPNSVELFLYGEANGFYSANTSNSFISRRISEMSDTERCTFVKEFARLFHLHFVKYFLEINLRYNNAQQILTVLCTTLNKFRHSCDPNVEVVVLENGVVVGKTLRDIARDDELLVSYKANCMRHTRTERQTFLEKFNIECHCKYCKMSEIDEPCNLRLGIVCKACGDVVITPAHINCPKCDMNYNTLFIQYRIDLKTLEEKLFLAQSNGDERELYIVYKIYFLYANRSFVPSNELRINIALKFAKFLALKNFADQSHDIIRELSNCLLNNYDENHIWFTLYADILLIIKIILHYNLNEGLYSISTSYLSDLCQLGLYIINGQKNHSRLYEIFDYKSGQILDDLRVFLEWKDKVICGDLKALANSFRKASQLNISSNSQLQIMPTLSEVPF